VEEETIEIRNRILKAAEERFFRFGFSKVTMDEIASELGMSKKTLYISQARKIFCEE
jgi:AcrR family transcriptional regulator